MLSPHIIVNRSSIDGIGLITTQAIPRGSVVWMPCRSCEIWSPEAIAQVSEERASWLDKYAYTLASGSALLPCHDAYVMNHSCSANVLDFGLDFGVAVRDIAAGEEITLDYRTFVNDPPWTIQCVCGAQGCVGQFQAQDGLAPAVQNQWRAAIQAVLPLVPKVQQPLHAVLLECSPSYRRLVDGQPELVLDGSVSIRQPGFLLDRESMVAPQV
jgi:hypothetical protein